VLAAEFYDQQTSIGEYLTLDYRVIKAEPASSPYQASGESVTILLSIHTGVILTTQWPTQGLWPTVLH